MNNDKDLRDALSLVLAELEKTNVDNPNSGACIFTPPSGRPQCLQLTVKQCQDIKGVYVGGPCSNIDLNAEIVGDSPIVEEEDDSEEDCTCTSEGRTYSKGSTICNGGKQYKCGCSGWYSTGFNC